MVRFAYFFLPSSTISTEAEFADWLRLRPLQNDARRDEIRRDFPVPWFTFAALEPGADGPVIRLDDVKTSWVARLDGFRPPQFGPATGGGFSVRGLCSDEIAAARRAAGSSSMPEEARAGEVVNSQINRANARPPLTIGAMCRSRSAVLADLYHHFKLYPPNVGRSSAQQAEEESRKFIGALTDSGYCPCYADAKKDSKSADKRCAVVGKL